VKIYSLVKVEFYKLLHKRLTRVMLGTLFIPAFYTFSVVTDAKLLQMMPAGALDFALAQWDLLGMTGLFQILFSLTTVGILSSEMEKGQLHLAVIKTCERKKLVYAKAFVLVLFMLMCYVFYLLFSLGCYYIFVIQTPYGTGELIGEGLKILGVTFVVAGMLPLMDSLIITGTVFLFSLRCKTATCFMLAIGMSTLLLFLQFFPGVKYLVPAHVGQLLCYGRIPPLLAAMLCLLYLAFTVVCIVAAAKKFERMDLK
jgi:ABC-type transport system involved in multi-copper enzyme maturation permease subunit